MSFMATQETVPARGETGRQPRESIECELAVVVVFKPF